MQRTRVTTWAAIGLLVLIAAACGGTAGSPGVSAPAGSAPASVGAPTVPPGGTLDACALLTAAEVGGALAVQVTGVEPVPAGPTQASCIYRAGTDIALTTLYGTLGAVIVDTYLDDVDAEPVPGLGDRAAIYGPVTLYVKKGDSYMALNVLLQAAADPKAVLRTLGALAVPRM